MTLDSASGLSFWALEGTRDKFGKCQAGRQSWVQTFSVQTFWEVRTLFLRLHDMLIDPRMRKKGHRGFIVLFATTQSFLLTV